MYFIYFIIYNIGYIMNYYEDTIANNINNLLTYPTNE